MLCDAHAHSEFSFDSQTPIDEMCGEYISKGFERAVMTDHYDIDGIEDGLYDPYDARCARRSFELAAEKYAGKFDLVWGIELGQPQLRADNARRFIAEHGFEFVVGSIHNLDMCPDFCLLNYSHMPDEMIRRLYSGYIDALSEVVRFGAIHTLAHATYPMRYIHRDDRTLEVDRFYDDYRRLFREMIDSGIALEINTGKVRDGYVTSPDVDLIELYRDSGGTRVTVGSDAHRLGDYGADVESTVRMLGKMGFSELVIPNRRGTESIPIE